MGIAISASDIADAGAGGADSTEIANADGDSSNRLEEIRADLNSEIARGLLEVEREGDMIVIRLASQGSFESGSALLQSELSQHARTGEREYRYWRQHGQS